MWCDRIEFESITASRPSTFLTLTYDDKYLPKNRSVRLKDVQDFFKRFRYYCARNDIPEFRYFLSSEYGDTTFRPHYHACITNFDCFDQKSFSALFDAWRDPATKDPIGIFTADGLLPARIRYTVSYINYLTPVEVKAYAAIGLKKPFHCMSKGIGKDWMVAHYDELLASHGYYHEGILRPLPRYYQLKLGLAEKNTYISRLSDIWSKYNEKLAYHNLPLVDPFDVKRFMLDYYCDADANPLWVTRPSTGVFCFQMPDAAMNEARELKLLHKEYLKRCAKTA